MMNAAARVALVMPFRNEAEHLPRVLATLAAQEFERDRMRLIAVDDASTDDGRATVAAFLARGELHGELVGAPGGSIPRALNAGIGRVRPDEIVIRVDAHALYSPTYVADVVEAFERLPGHVWCVGGAGLPERPSHFGLALHAALFTNPMGFGPAAYRRRAPEPAAVSSVYLGAWRPGVLQHLGGFDERWRANEDAELAERLRRAGGLVYRIPADARRIVTRGPAATVRQWTRYGFWRAQTLKRYPGATRLRHLAPPFALLGAAALAATRYRPLLVPLAGAYATATVLAREPGEAPAVTAASVAFFPLVHAGYAAGLIAGLAVDAVGREAHLDDGP